MGQAWRAVGNLIPWLLLGTLLAIPLVALFAERRRHRHHESWRVVVSRVAVLVGALGALLLVVGTTLTPLGGLGAARTSTNWVPFAMIAGQVATSDVTLLIRNVLFNLLLFVPVGLTGALLAGQVGRSWLHAVVAGAGLSVAIEATQLLLPLGRAADVDDVLLNTLGALVGALAAEAGRRLVRAVYPGAATGAPV